MSRYATLVAIGCIWGSAAMAQNAAPTNADLLQKMQAMEDRIRSLEAEVASLKGKPAAAVETPALTQPPAAQPAPENVVAQTPPPVSIGGAGGSASKVFNPDISVIGDFLGAAGNGGPRGQPSLEMHESEVGLQAILDPYARADFFISFGEEGVEVEEGYLTFPALKGGFELKAGKMRAAFGKVNALHNHVLPWTDRPLVSQDLVGGEDGIDDAGLSLTRIFAGPGGLFLEGTAQVFRGDSSDVFKAYRRNDLSTVGHFRGYKDLSESTNLDLGFSYARGHSAASEPLINQLYGLDGTFRWKPLRRGLYHSLVARSEWVWDRNEAATTKNSALGYYFSADYQLNRRWFLGGRFDRSELSTNSNVHDTGGSLVLTYWPSEFSQVRGQLRRTSYAGGLDANELLFQFMFSIGAHGAHPF